MKSEAELKSELVDHLKKAFPKAVIIRHEDRYRHGVPDISFTLGHTLWFEAKVARPSRLEPQLSGKGIQKVTCLQLQGAANNCFYVIWRYEKDTISTLIVTPSMVHNNQWTHQYVKYGPGINHTIVEILCRDLNKLHGRCQGCNNPSCKDCFDYD